MADKLTKKQKGFAKDYLDTGNATQAALRNYNTDSYGTAAVIGHENLNKPKVQEYLASRADRAAEIVYQLAEAGETDSVRLNASKDILDRAGFKAVDKSVLVNLNVEVEADEVVKQLTEHLNEVYRNSGGSGDGTTASSLGNQA